MCPKLTIQNFCSYKAMCRKTMLYRWQWLWKSLQSGLFQHKNFAIRIPPSVNITSLKSVKCIEITKEPTWNSFIKEYKEVTITTRPQVKTSRQIVVAVVAIYAFYEKFDAWP